MLALLENRGMLHRAFLRPMGCHCSISHNSIALLPRLAKNGMSNFFAKKTLKNTSKFACQAPKPLNPLPINNICTKESFPQSAIIELEGKAESPGQKGQGFLF
jgi:hypothetical protein